MVSFDTAISMLKLQKEIKKDITKYVKAKSKPTEYKMVGLPTDLTVLPTFKIPVAKKKTPTLSTTKSKIRARTREYLTTAPASVLTSRQPQDTTTKEGQIWNIIRKRTFLTPQELITAEGTNIDLNIQLGETGSGVSLPRLTNGFSFPKIDWKIVGLILGGLGAIYLLGKGIGKK